jgi:hypothetical protein
MINKTIHQVQVGEAWHAFMTRKTLVTAWAPGFVPMRYMAVGFPPLRGVLGAMLYAELVSLFDSFCESQITQPRWKKVGSLDAKIKALDSEGKIVDAGKLHAMRTRRNKIAHEVEQPVERADLDEAIATVQKQLEAWNLVGPARKYEAFMEHAPKDNPRPGASETHWTVGVQCDGKAVLKFQWDELLLPHPSAWTKTERAE